MTDIEIFNALQEDHDLVHISKDGTTLYVWANDGMISLYSPDGKNFHTLDDEGINQYLHDAFKQMLEES